MSAIAERVAEVRGRVGPDIAIVAVTKGFDADVARQAMDAGLVDLGENYAQALVAKSAEVPGARWHFLGHIQRNKVAALSPHVHLWQGVDRADALGAGANALVQVNLSGLAQRNGCSWEDAPALIDVLAASGVAVQGVMGVAGPGDPRPQFRRLAALASELGLPEVSMGMSGDYEIAVEEGSTMVRLGTALFGPRPDPARLRR
jgi:uncharacterized pyridoxal phosphate-containing UPF0001 family protein